MPGHTPKFANNEPGSPLRTCKSIMTRRADGGRCSRLGAWASGRLLSVETNPKMETTLTEDFVLCNLSSCLTLRDTLRLGSVCKRLRAQLEEPFLWEYLIQTKFSGMDKRLQNGFLIEDVAHPKHRYLQTILSQKVSTAGKDVCIAGLSIPDDPKQETWWILEEGGDFGHYATLRTICWGEWFAWRYLPAGDYDLVLRTRWTTADFDRVERPTLYQCRLLPPDAADPSTLRADPATGVDRFNRVKGLLEGAGAPLADFAVSDADRAALRATRGHWVHHNLGTVHVPRPGLVTVR